MVNIRKFLEGIGLIPKSSSTIDSAGEMEFLSSSNKFNIHNGTSASPLVSEAHSATLTNKTIDADSNTITNIENADIKTGAAIDALKIGAGTVSNTEFGYLDGVTSPIQTQLNASMSNALTDSHIFVGNASNVATDVAVSGDLTLTNTGNFQIAAGVIVNNDINATAAIDATKIGNGDVDNTELSYVNGVTSSIQTQLNAKITASSTDTLTNKTVTDNSFTIQDDGDNTKKAQFQASGITTGTTRTFTFPDANTTLVGTDATQTLTNKTLTAPVISTISNTGTLTLPTSTDTLVGRATTDTLTNKTLTAPVISTISNTGTLTLPTSTDTLVGRATTDTLTNKTLTSPSLTTPSTDVVTWDDQASTPSNPSAGFYKTYFKTDGNFYKLNSAGTETQIGSGGGGSAPNSYVFVGVGNGYGSTNNRIRRFTTTNASVGTDITYADSATNGASFTINTTGIYAIYRSDSSTAANTAFGISVNPSSGATTIGALTYANGRRGYVSAAQNTYGHITAVLYLTATDVVRPHDEGDTGATTDEVMFAIIRIA